LTEGLRSFPVGNHIAYCVERKGKIEIARILHPAMDTEKAMKKADKEGLAGDQATEKIL